MSRVLVLVCVLLTLLLSACRAGSASVNWSLGPIVISVDTAGNVSVAGQASFVTPVGTFSIEQGADVTAADDEIVLVLRHREKGLVVETAYSVPTDADVTIVVDGRSELGIRGRTVTLDATRGIVSKIVLNGVTWPMPNLVGAVLQDAQDRIQSLTGDRIFFTTSHDASGASRNQIWDANWKVCTQSIAPETPITVGTEIDFGAVKLDESCPSRVESRDVPTNPT